MSSFPCLARFVSGSGQVRYRLGERLVDRYLEFRAKVTEMYKSVAEQPHRAPL